MAKYPKDQFDDIPADLSRVGAHRAPAKPGRAWITVGWAALVTVIFILGGVYFLDVLTKQLAFDGGTGVTATAAPTADPILDPKDIAKDREITITVLNGTSADGVEKTVYKVLDKAKWPVGARALASDRSQEITVVYYSNPADEDVARGLILALGVGEIRESNAFVGAPLTIVVGADYLALGATPTPTSTDTEG
jgi:hypothetical protein